MDACFTEFGDGNANNFKKFEKSYVYVVFIDQISVRRLLQIGRFGLRNEDFFDFHLQL